MLSLFRPSSEVVKEGRILRQIKRLWLFKVSDNSLQGKIVKR